MRLLDLAIFYLLLGVGSCWLAASRGRRGAGDLAMALLLWPLYIPVAFSSPQPQAPSRGDHPEYRALLAALASVRNEHLAALLPKEPQLRPLAERLRVLEDKASELDEVLARDEFAAAEREPHVRESLEQLQALRAGALRERDELVALCRRLRVQVTVLRFSGSSTDGVGDLVSELLGRLEGMQVAFSEPTGGARG